MDQTTANSAANGNTVGNPPRKLRVLLETYGCQMNEYDTELVKAILAEKKYTFTKDENEADIIMLNTCAIRENAHRKVYGRIHELRHARRKQLNAAQENLPEEERKHLKKHEEIPGLLIGVLGCMATNLRTELLENKKLEIDFIAGPDSYKRLPQLIEEAQSSGKKQFDVTLSEFETYSDVSPSRKEGANAWIATSRGCNNFCTFCVVPYTRGRERSRSLPNIVEEVQKLAAEGFKQVTLLGQNVNSYNHENHDFADLMQAVSEVNGIERVRFTSPHPKDFPVKLLKTIAANKRLCKSIHLPLQAGNNRVLELMDRTYTREEFLDLVKTTRELIPNATLSTDVIVGFPTETDAEFEETMKLMEEMRFDIAYTFKYSQRKNTIASRKYPDDVSEEVKTQRIMKLTELQRQISLEKNREHIGTVMEMLIESESTSKSNDIFRGRTDGNKIVDIPRGPYKVGDFVNIKIFDASANILKGMPV